MYKRIDSEQVYQRPGIIQRIGFWFIAGNHLQDLLLPLSILVYLSFSVATNYYSAKDFCPLQDCKGIEIDNIGNLK